MRQKGIIIAVLFVILGLHTAESKTYKSNVYNYIGVDGVRRYVITYQDDKTGSTLSAEWKPHYNPDFYGGDIQPRLRDNKNNMNPNMVALSYPFDVHCEFKATKNSNIEIRTKEDITFEIIDFKTGNTILKRTKLNANSQMQKFHIRSVDSSTPYILMAYKNNKPVYMEMFFFKNEYYNSRQKYCAPRCKA